MLSILIHYTPYSSLYPTQDTLDTQDHESETQQIREQFITYWKELVELEDENFNEKKNKPHQTISTTLNANRGGKKTSIEKLTTHFNFIRTSKETLDNKLTLKIC